MWYSFLALNMDSFEFYSASCETNFRHTMGSWTTEVYWNGNVKGQLLSLFNDHSVAVYDNKMLLKAAFLSSVWIKSRLH